MLSGRARTRPAPLSVQQQQCNGHGRTLVQFPRYMGSGFVQAAGTACLQANSRVTCHRQLALQAQYCASVQKLGSAGAPIVNTYAAQRVQGLVWRGLATGLATSQVRPVTTDPHHDAGGRVHFKPTLGLPHCARRHYTRIATTCALQLSTQWLPCAKRDPEKVIFAARLLRGPQGLMLHACMHAAPPAARAHHAGLGAHHVPSWRQPHMRPPCTLCCRAPASGGRATWHTPRPPPAPARSTSCLRARSASTSWSAARCAPVLVPAQSSPPASPGLYHSLTPGDRPCSSPGAMLACPGINPLGADATRV